MDPTKMKPADVRLNTYKEMVGKTINDRYELQGLIGFGGMGAVFQGLQRAINRTVAIKVLPKLDPLTAARFHREAKTASRLAHPNTITVFDFGQTADEFLFLVMEYLEGRTLRTVLKECGRIHPSRAIHIATQVCRSLSEAHAMGIVHRDIKPDNIYLIHRDDDPDYVKVLDFGIAKVLQGDEVDADLTQQGRIVGTPRYMAPEQVMSLPIDHRADIYSLGVILYQMVTGVPPFDDSSTPMLMMKHAHETPDEFAKKLTEDVEGLSQIPPGLEAVIMKSLTKRPEDRQQTIDQLRIELGQIRMSLSGIHPLPPMGAYTSGVMPSIGNITPNPNNQSNPHLAGSDVSSPSHPSFPQNPSNPSYPSSPSQQALSAPSMSHPALSNPNLSNPSLTPPSMSNPSLSHPSMSHPGYGPPRSNTGLIVGLIVAALLLGGGIALGIYFNGQFDRDARADLAAQADERRAEERAADERASVDSAASAYRITVQSEPPGASIHSGELIVGTTPMVIEVPAEVGTVTYSVRKDGFAPVTKEFVMKRLPGKEVTWRAELVKADAADAKAAVADKAEGSDAKAEEDEAKASAGRNTRPPVNNRWNRPPRNVGRQAARDDSADNADKGSKEEAPKAEEKQEEVAETAPPKERKPKVTILGETERRPKVGIIGGGGTEKDERDTGGKKPSVPTLE